MRKYYKTPLLVLFVFILCSILSSCRHDRVVNTSFYFWKTVYKNNKTETACLGHFKSHQLYMRIMDVDLDENGINPVPVSPITFQDKLPDSVEIIPVVFIVNNLLKVTTRHQLDDLARNMVGFVNGKVRQAGKTSFSQLQIDCDWTASTRENYFYLLKQLRQLKELKGKVLSATLRLHQIKNQKGSGIPPVNRVMLMCYNMGNLRKYGQQNSIIEISELKKYLGNNVTSYPMPVDVGLPLFSWAVAFRDKQYIGIAKRINMVELNNKNQFIFIGNNIYRAKTDLPDDGLKINDEVRWENVSAANLRSAARYLAPLIKADTVNVIYFHLDEAIVRTYTYDNLEKTDHLFR
ncbi:hypothetical protein [Mucilaginibacter sp. SP1R1]|uniref:hypothetical protein n=1 Tax=Mucilaginibacter sp. SP1R1 TaxID=2723091 RepID=UPI00161DB26D|nr:hypothetical protein [Mucilaginibacter sp. SP1R1]MBB6150395.1 hypothetical protein [Mucilaginibacter sp. SP1R1]